MVMRRATIEDWQEDAEAAAAAVAAAVSDADVEDERNEWRVLFVACIR